MEKLSRAPQLALGVTLTSHCPHLNLPILILTRIIPRLVRANHFPHTIEFNFRFFFKIAFIFRLSKNRTAFHNLPFLSYFLHVLGPKSMYVIFSLAQSRYFLGFIEFKTGFGTRNKFLKNFRLRIRGGCLKYLGMKNPGNKNPQILKNPEDPG